jgi:hypothetical protein
VSNSATRYTTTCVGVRLSVLRPSEDSYVKERFEFSEWSRLKLALCCEDFAVVLHEHHALNQANSLESTLLRQFMHVHTEQDGAEHNQHEAAQCHTAQPSRTWPQQLADASRR